MQAWVGASDRHTSRRQLFLISLTILMMRAMQVQFRTTMKRYRWALGTGFPIALVLLIGVLFWSKANQDQDFREIDLLLLGKVVDTSAGRSISLRGMDINASILDRVGKMKDVMVLDCGKTLTCDNDLKHLSSLTALRQLQLDRTMLRGDGLAYLKCDDLISLDVSFSRFSDENLVHVRDMSSLQILKLRGTHIGDEGLSNLRDLYHLRQLNLSSTRVGDEGLKQLINLPHLAELDISGTRVTGAGLVHVGRIANLVTLHLDEVQITDDALTPICDLPLQTLTVGKTKITDAGVRYLSRIKSLEVLSLWGCELTDDTVEHLAKLDRLRVVYLGDTNVTSQARLKLRADRKIWIFGVESEQKAAKPSKSISTTGE